MSIEAFVSANLLMNLVILSVSARCAGHIRWRRVICAALLGTAYAAAAYGWERMSWLKSAAAQALCLLAMAWVLFGKKGGRLPWRGMAYLTASTLFSGGVMALLGRWLNPGGLPVMLVGWSVIAAAAFVSDGFRDGVPAAHRVKVRIGTRMGRVELCALVDTGNRLREPLSGLPVLIAGADSLRGILDEECLHQSGNRLLPGFRRVAYRVLGGSGQMICFRPESVEIADGNGWLEAPDVWVGIYAGQMPAQVEALAPIVLGRMNSGGERMMDMS